MCAAGALRGSPASTTMTDRRGARAGGRREPGGRSADDGDVAVTLDGGGRGHSCPRRYSGSSKAQASLRYSQDFGGTMAELNEIEQVVRARLRSCATPWACRSTSSPHAPTSVPPPSAASRRANERSAWTSCCRWPAPSRSTSTSCSMSAATTMSSSARRQTGRASAQPGCSAGQPAPRSP